MKTTQYLRIQSGALVIVDKVLEVCDLGTNGNGMNNKKMKDGHCQVRGKRDPLRSGTGLQHRLRSHLHGTLKKIVTGKALQDMDLKHFQRKDSQTSLNRQGSS